MKAFLIAAGMMLAAGLSGCGGSEQPPQQQEIATKPQMNEGERLFKQNCAVCHNLDKDATGPALRGALARWNNDKERLKKYIKNAPQVIREGDPYATALYEKWNKTMMTPFPGLTDEELNALIEYINQ